MNVAYVHPSFPGSEGSGATHSATQIVRGLRERGHDVTVFCPSDVPAQVREGDDRLVALEIDPQFPRHFGEELNRAIRERSDRLAEFDIVHSYLMQALPAIGRLARETGVKTAVTLNAYLAICPKNDLRYMGSEPCDANGTVKCGKCLTHDVLQKAPRYEEPAAEKVLRVPHRWTNALRRLRLVSRGLEYVDDVAAFRAPSAHVKWHHTDFGFDGERIRVIPHPVDDAFRVPHESDFAEPYQLLYVGTLKDHKGVDRLVPTVERLREVSNREFELTIVGSGRMRSRIERQIREADLGEAVELRGFVPYEELPGVYARSDLFVFPVRWDEPFARVYLEALASETPIVTTAFGDIETMLGDACRTTDGTPEDMARAIDSIVSSESLPAMSDAATATVDRYSLETVVENVELLYTGIVDQPTTE